MMFELNLLTSKCDCFNHRRGTLQRISVIVQQIPAQCKVRLRNEEHFALVAQERTRAKVMARMAEISEKPHLDFLPLDPRAAAAARGAARGPVRTNYRQEHSESSFRASQSLALTSAQAYIGFTHKYDKQMAKIEWARFAVHRSKKDTPAFTRRDNTRLKTWEDLQATGFKVLYARGCPTRPCIGADAIWSSVAPIQRIHRPSDRFLLV
jgi:hypothetical protein